MKSEITKRGYFILLISLLSISTFTTVRTICNYPRWKFPHTSSIYYGTGLLLEMFVWIMLLSKHRKLRIAVITWSSAYLLKGIAEDLFALFKSEHPVTINFFLDNAVMVIFVVMLLGGIKYITIISEPDQEISN